MIVFSRHINCNFCGEWANVADAETAQQARNRLRRRGWRVLPHADQHGRLMDVCPRHRQGEDHANKDEGGSDTGRS